MDETAKGSGRLPGIAADALVVVIMEINMNHSAIGGRLLSDYPADFP